MNKKKMLFVFLLVLVCQLTWGEEVIKLENLPQSLHLSQGKSCLVLGQGITRVISGNPQVLEVAVLSDKELILHSKAVGRTNLIIYADENYWQTQVTVYLPEAWSPEEIASALGISTVKVSRQGNAAVLDGTVKKEEERRRAEEIAKLYTPEVLNYLTLPVAKKEQVAIKVRIVELSNNSWERLGVLWGTELGGADGQPQVGISTKGEFKLAAALHLLEAQGKAKLIAEPALLSIDGGEASFLAGGEMPIPVIVQEQVAVDWKPYGIKLELTAKLEEELVRVRLRPEVSHLDWNRGIRIGGSTVPALATRRAQTEVYLPSGGTVVIAGLGQQQSGYSNRNLPWWGRLPLIGRIFRYGIWEESQTELAIFLTAWRTDSLPESAFSDGEINKSGNGGECSSLARAEKWQNEER